MSEDPYRDAVPGDGRDETPAERLDRNWNDVLQELRVTQTGSQLIAGFLLTIPFQQRFTDLDHVQVSIYLVLVTLAASTAALSLAPVSLHRSLFRQQAKDHLVRVANVVVRLVLAAVATVIAGTLLLIFDVVVGRTEGIIVGVTALVLMLGGAVLLPLGAKRGGRPT